MNKFFKYIQEPSKIILYLMNKNFFWWLSDEKYLKLKYRLVMKSRLNLDNPKTFNEKMQWLKLYDRNHEYIKLVDKYEVKEYIKQRLGEEYVIPLIGVYDKFDDIDFRKLPKQFVIKCTHNSGGVIVCTDKENLDIKSTRKKINKYMKEKFYYLGREWPYKNVKPRIIIEKYMEDKKNKELIDYKVMCFNGRPKMNFTCTERFNNGLKVTFFDMNWNKLSFERHYPKSNKEIKKPKNYEKMIEFSKLLSKDIPFVRVDWYEIDGKLYFGELTFYPGSGMEEFTHNEWDLKIGEMLDISNIKTYKNSKEKKLED